ncbi:hypothetical protein MMC34_002572 [Xylographa carneopallida]|nr:hypothetical protein [Xylographa carneopallida]
MTPLVKYFLNRQPSGFHFGSVLEEVDEKGDPNVASKSRSNSHDRSKDESVAPTDKQSDILLGILLGTSWPTTSTDNLPGDVALVPLAPENDSVPRTSASETVSSNFGRGISESFKHHIQAWNLGQELLALHASISKDPCLASHHSGTRHTARGMTSDDGSTSSLLNSHVLVLHYGIGMTNIATGDLPSLVDAQEFTAFGISANNPIDHLIRSIDFMAAAACEKGRPHQLVIWAQNERNEWIPGEVGFLGSKNERLTLEDIGWKGGIDNHVRISLLKRPYRLEFCKDVGAWRCRRLAE